MVFTLVCVIVALTVAVGDESSNVSRAVLVADDVDAQLEDEDSNVEWLIQSELKARIAARESQIRETRRYTSDRAAKDALLQAMADDVRSRKLQTISEVQATNGPLFPVWEEDLIPDESKVFATISPNVSVDVRPPIPLNPEAGCDVTAMAHCPTDLSQCLGTHAEDRDSSCECFSSNGKCYRQYGCLEMLPKSTINFCFYRLYCTMDQCEGSGASAAAPFGGYLLLLLLLACVMLLLGRQDER